MARNRRMLCFAIACLGCLLTVSHPADGQQTPAANPVSTQRTLPCQGASADPRRRRTVCNDEDFDLDETLARGWNDVRRKMQRIGITPTASYVGALQTNVSGGQHRVWSYAGQLSLAFSVDFGQLLKVPGLSAYVGTSWGTGSNLSASLDTAIPTSSLYAPSFYLGEMYLQQKLLHKKLVLLAGRLAASDGFAALPVFTNYVTYGINPNPISLGANDISFAGPPPGAEWGVQASYAVTHSIQFAAGIFNTSLNSANGENHGADFALQEGNKGVLSIGEFDYFRNERTDSTGMPGEIAVGFLHSNNSFPSLSNPLARSDGYSGVYLMGQQMVFRPGSPGTSRGATIWGAWTFSSKDLISPIPLLFGAGVSYEGLVPARKNDVVSIGWIRSDASKYIRPTNTEDGLELNYQWRHSRFLTITPHGQYLWKQSSHPNRNATVLGIQVALTL